MKTVIDAVIYYCGYNFINGKHEENHTHIISIHKTERIGTAYASDIGMNAIICGIKTYNDLISELETNFGTSVRYSEYKERFDNKLVSACCSCCNHEWSCKRSIIETMACPDCGDKPESIIKHQPKPTYTQAMADAGELPSVGDDVALVEDTKLLSCHYDMTYDLSANDKVTVVSIGIRPDNGSTLITVTNGKGFATINPDWLKPLTPPIELIDGKAYQFDYDEGNTLLIGVYGLYDCNGSCIWVKGDYYELDRCTNIIELVAKGGV